MLLYIYTYVPITVRTVVITDTYISIVCNTRILTMCPGHVKRRHTYR